MTPEELRKLIDEATDAPWKFSRHSNCLDGGWDCAIYGDGYPVLMADDDECPDAELICALRNRASAFLRLWEWAIEAQERHGELKSKQILADLSGEGGEIGGGE